MRMIAMKCSWLLMELLLTAVFLRFGSAGALALAAALILIPLASIPMNYLLRRNLRIQISGPVSQRKGENSAVELLLENPSRFPVLRLRCRLTAENQLNRNRQTAPVMTWITPKGSQRLTMELDSAWCGRIRIRADQVKLYDCFGLVGIRCASEAVTHVTVLPDVFDMDISLAQVSETNAESEAYAQDRPGSDLTEVWQIREYVPGDSPRQIHWKLSGKFDRLIVRDPALPITKNVLVYWERTGDAEDPALIDAQAESVVSLCFGLLEQGMQFTLGWNDTDRNLCILHEIRDMDELVGVLPRLMRASGTEKGISGAGLLVQTRPDALCGHMVYIARIPQPEAEQMRGYGHVTMLVCGDKGPEDAVLFRPEDYRQKLMQIEL